MTQLYTVVKYATGAIWRYYHSYDPTVYGVPVSNVHQSYTGKLIGVQPHYADKNLAELICAKCNTENPVGHYAVCPLITK